MSQKVLLSTSHWLNLHVCLISLFHWSHLGHRQTRIETCSPLKNHQTYSSVEARLPPEAVEKWCSFTLQF